MNDRCERYTRENRRLDRARDRARMSRAALDLHCAECESCREYRSGCSMTIPGSTRLPRSTRHRNSALRGTSDRNAPC